MKKPLLTFASVLLTCSAAFSQAAPTQTLAFSDGVGTPNAGTYSPNSTFTLTTSVTFAGYSASGLSYWLQVPNALAPFLTITGGAYLTFTDGNQPDYPKTFSDNTGAAGGFVSDKGAANSGDLGATTAGADVTPGTYDITTLSFSIANGAPAGIYSLQTTDVAPKGSEVSGGAADNFTTHNLSSQAVYTITVVPEPSTWLLLAAGTAALVGVGTKRLRRQRAWRDACD